MAKTGIKKYDRLPARMGFTDVDCIRANYVICEAEISQSKKCLSCFKKELNKIVRLYEKGEKRNEN